MALVLNNDSDDDDSFSLHKVGLFQQNQSMKSQSISDDILNSNLSSLRNQALIDEIVQPDTPCRCDIF